MSIATLGDIITKVRKLTGSANSFQLTDADIVDYVNSFYLYDFPAQYRSLKLEDLYTFNTVKGIDTYPFDAEHYSTVKMPCYCMNREIKLFQDPWQFYGVNFNWQYQQNFATGDGTAGPYTGTASSTPLIRSVNNNPIVPTPLSSTGVFPSGVPVSFANSSINRVQNLLITANRTLGSTLNVTDDGNGNLIGNATAGTINYETGAISVTFSDTVPSGTEIQIQYNPTQLSIPLSILFFQNQFTLRPVPDRGYNIKLVAYRLPSQAILGSTDPDSPVTTGVPELREWWETLCFGAAKKVFQDRLDSDGVALMNTFLMEAYALNESRTYAEMGSQRIPTLFSDQLSNNYGSSGWGFGNAGST